MLYLQLSLQNPKNFRTCKLFTVLNSRTTFERDLPSSDSVTKICDTETLGFLALNFSRNFFGLARMHKIVLGSTAKRFFKTIASCSSGLQCVIICLLQLAMDLFLQGRVIEKPQSVGKVNCFNQSLFLTLIFGG